MYSPGPANDVLACAIGQGFGNATLGGPNAPSGNNPPQSLLFGAAEVELTAASIVLTFAQRNGFPGAQYLGGTLVSVPNSYGGVSPYIQNPAGITLPPPDVVSG